MSESCARCQSDHLPHSHRFEEIHPENERRTLIVVVLTLLTMTAEILFGVMSGSMALLSDGWHMGTHAAALGIAWFAYHYSRKNANNRRYTFGTGKIGVLAAFASAIILGMTGLLIFGESVMRLLYPVKISFNTAILVAVIGLFVNLLCALILKGHHHHRHDHGDHHFHESEHDHESCEHNEHGEHHSDQNDKAALIHVTADAMTSLFAIVALFVGKYYGLVLLDPLVGFLGAFLILWWAGGIVSRSAGILLDCDPSSELTKKIRETLESDKNVQLLDLHVWRLSENRLGALVSLIDSQSRSPEYFKEKLAAFDVIAHINIEIHHEECDNSL